MVLQMDLKDLERELAEYAAEREVLALYLFGSAARNQRTALSDIDIAVLLPDDIPKEEYFERKLKMIAELMGLLQEDDIDLVILNEAPPLLKHRVVTYGRVVFCRDERAWNRFRGPGDPGIPRFQAGVGAPVSIYEETTGGGEVRCSTPIPQSHDSPSLRSSWSSSAKFQGGIISKHLAQKLEQMIGLRNLLIYEYLEIDLESLYRIIQQDLDDLSEFAEHIKNFIEENRR